MKTSLLGRAALYLCAALLCVFAVVAHAQGTTGQISGTVVDPSGAVVPNATVTLTRTDINAVIRTVKTDGSGKYSAPNLPLGIYSVTATAPGFGDITTTGITLHVNDTLTINEAIKVNGSESVTVTTEQQQLNFENAAGQTTVEGAQVRELVLSTRNYEQLVGLQPGVAYSGADQLYIGNSSPNGATNVVQYSINGARTSGNAWLVDGADNVDRGSNYTLLTYPSVDAIAEFKTIRNTYSAEFGRSANGQVNVITKSGTNHFHGSAYEFVRNDIFNANDVTNKQNTTATGGAKPTVKRQPYRYNDFGYSIGGPVWLPKIYDGRTHKTYFFFSQELRRVIIYKSYTLAGVPNAAERTGHFAVPVCTSVNPANGNCNPGSTSTTVNSISAPAAAYIKDIYANVAEPDATGSLTVAPQRFLFNGNQQIVRVDQQVGQKLNIFFRLINDKIPTIEPGGLFQGNGYPGVNTTATNAPGRIYLGHFTYALTPTWLLDGGYAYTQGALLSDPTGTALNVNSPDVAPSITLPFASSLPRVPGLVFTGGTSISTYGPYRDYNRNHNVFMNVIKSHAGHTFKMGFSYNHYEKKENNAGANAGSFTFSQAGAPTGTTYQQSWANFLTGFTTTFSQASYDVTPDVKANQFEAYFQDDWKVTPRLTVNVGVRYSKFAQPTDGNSQLTTFDPSLYNPANAPTVEKSGTGNLCYNASSACTGGVAINTNGSLINGISINKVNSPYGAKVGRSDNWNFGPRLGFSLDVFGNGRTALRGGFGIAHDSALFGTYEQNIFQNKPFVNTPSYSNTSFANPAGGTLNATTPAQVVRATTPNFKTPYTEQWSLSIQQALGKGIVAEIGYVGNNQVHLLGLVDINQAAPGAFATAGLDGTVLAPVNVVGTTSTPINSGNEGFINQIRPYRGYSSINSVQTIFGGNYNSLQTSISKHWQHDSLFSANYTWSRSLTNAGADRTGAPQISSCPRCEYGRSNADRTHMFNFNTIYALPWFYSQRGVIGHILGGWQASGIGYFNSGLPLNVTTSSIDPAGVGVAFGSSVSSGRPDQIGDPNKNTAANPIHNRLHWFNPKAFTAVPAGQYRGGNAQRNVVDGPGWWRADVGVFKNLKIYDQVRLQFRGEAYNVFNHTNPDTISTAGTVSGYNTLTGVTTYGAAAGNITGYRDKRILQVGAKLIF